MQSDFGEWPGMQRVISTTDLQEIRGHIGKGLPFLITGGDNYAFVRGAEIQPARITIRGLALDVDNVQADFQFMNALTQSVREDKQVFISKAGAQHDQLRIVIAFRLVEGPTVWLDLVPADMKTMLTNQLQRSGEQ